jgi:hypothetical protein
MSVIPISAGLLASPPTFGASAVNGLREQIKSSPRSEAVGQQTNNLKVKTGSFNFKSGSNVPLYIAGALTLIFVLRR